MPAPPMSPSGRLFAVAAFVEGLTWAGLLVGMWLKYGAGITDAGVWLFGRLHGAAFLFYVAATLVAATRLRWPGWALLLGLLALLAAQALLRYVSAYWLGHVGESMLVSLQGEVHDRLQALPLTWHQARPRGDTLSILISDVWQLSQFISGTLVGLLIYLMRGRNFAKDYGVLLKNGPLAGLTARAVVVLDTDNKVLYTELVGEIANEPDYDAALKSLA